MKKSEEISMIITYKESGEFLGYASAHQVKKLAAKMNRCPRKCLGYKTP